MANSNTMARADAAKSHIGGNILMLDSAGDVGQTPFQGKIVAWVNFNGTGTVAIRGSANISSITDRGGVGLYALNFATALPDANYAVAGTAWYDGVTKAMTGVAGTPSTTSCNVNTDNNTGGVDALQCHYVVVR